MIAGIHAEAIAHMENARLVGVADNYLPAAEAFAERHSVKAYSTYAEMLADEEIDVVCICTPSAYHAPNAKQALLAGKHVVLEKPMALSTAEADELIAVCEQTGKKMTVICQFRFSPDVQKVKELIKEGAFGKLSLCNILMKYHRKTEYFTNSPWHGRLALEGGGALMNQGIHGIDLLEYVVGDIKRSTGRIATLSHDIEVEDTAVGMFEFENGALGVVEASTCAYPGFSRRMEIHGDRGYVLFKENRIEKLMIDGTEIKGEAIHAVSTANDPAALGYEMHRMQLSNLLDAIEGKEALLIDGREGRKAIKVIEDIYRSAGRDAIG